ncbi:MAG TPA: NAD(P)-dependent oxidoreductase [Acidobacteriaceae bacterium]|nr:NAD(P)-dependent oxidoreductase [Acidobacteriaceae bacterium]
MRCLVTGALGFLGSHLVRELLARQHSVVILLRPGTQLDRVQNCLSRVSIVRGNLEDTSELLRALLLEPVDAAFHLAWSGATAEYQNSTNQVTYNVTRTLELWQVLEKTGCGVFIGVGYQPEYGPHLGLLSEEMPTNPVTAYGSSKLVLFIVLRQPCLTAGMRFIWMRLFSAYGLADHERHMVPSLIQTLLRRERPSLTAGEQIWDYLDVTDAVVAICISMECEAAGVFNLGSGTPCVLREFIAEVRNCIDPVLPVGLGEVPYPPGQVMRLEADVSSIRKATGWIPTTSWQEGIRKSVDWHRIHCQSSADVLVQNHLTVPSQTERNR